METLSIEQTLENACCLWESTIHLLSEADEDDPISIEFDYRGCGEMRMIVGSQAWAMCVEEAWEWTQTQLKYSGCFDLEFCPLFLSVCVNWRGLFIYPDWKVKLTQNIQEN